MGGGEELCGGEATEIYTRDLSKGVCIVTVGKLLETRYCFLNLYLFISLNPHSNLTRLVF